MFENYINKMKEEDQTGEHKQEGLQFMNNILADQHALHNQIVKIQTMTDSELYEFDFSDVKGQENVKRALEISAAGGHNCILIRKSRCWKNNVSKTISKYITRYKF